MSLTVAVYVPTGIAISADSRTVVTRTVEGVVGGEARKDVSRVVLSDATEKVLVVSERFAVATWGEAYVGDRPIAHHIRRHELTSPPAASAPTLADSLMGYFASFDPVPKVYFLVAGYEAAEPHLLTVDVASGRTESPSRNAAGEAVFGILRGGDTDIANRLLSNEQLLPPFHLMNLQDAVDYSRHLIRTTIDEMRFEPMMPTVGGPVDTLVIETDGVPVFLSRKALRAD